MRARALRNPPKIELGKSNGFFRIDVAHDHGGQFGRRIVFGVKAPRLGAGHVLQV